MNKYSIVFLGLSALFVASTGCKVSTGEDTAANVNCKGQKDGIDCEISQTKGTVESKVCWDLKVTCKNGTVVTGSSCGTVSNGGKVSALIPNAQLANEDKCDAADNMAVLNMKIAKP